MKLTSALKSLITEAAALDQVVDAVKKRKKIIIYYDGDEPGGKGLREIEPVCIGRTKNRKNLVVRAWDNEGASHRGFLGTRPMPGWRLFRLDRMGNYSVDPRETFITPKPLYNPNDKGMKSIMICAKFENENI